MLKQHTTAREEKQKPQVYLNARAVDISEFAKDYFSKRSSSVQPNRPRLLREGQYTK